MPFIDVDRPVISLLGPARLLIGIFGGLTIGIAGLLAFVPREFPPAAIEIVGSAIFAAGVVEIMVGATAARWATVSVSASGLWSIGAGLVILVGKPETFFSLSAIVTAWLVVRAIILLLLAVRAPWRPARAWLMAAGAANGFLAFMAVFITMSGMVAHLFFGPAPRGAGYSIIPALSLLFNGILFAAAPLAPRMPTAFDPTGGARS